MSIPPQTGAGGQANAQDLLQQVLAVSGGGGGGMVPPGSTGISAFSTLGTNNVALYTASGALNIPNYSAVPTGSTGITSLATPNTGAASYSPSTGILSIPVFASGVLNAQKSYLTANATSNSTTQLAMGNGTGFLFTANVNPCVVISFAQLLSLSVSSLIPAIIIVRSTSTTIPPSGTAIPAPDAPLLETKMVGQTTPYSISGSVIDTGITVGVTYCYYLAMWLSIGTGTATATSGISNSSFSAFEVK